MQSNNAIGLVDVLIKALVSFRDGISGAAPASAESSETTETPTNANTVGFPTVDEIREMGKDEHIALFNSLGVEKPPKAAVKLLTCLTLLSSILHDIVENPKKVDRQVLCELVDALGVPRRKSNKNTLADVQTFFAEQKAAKDDAPADGADPSAPPDEVDDRKPASEGDGSEGEGGDGEGNEDDEEMYLAFAKSEIGDEDELDEVAAKSQLQTWLEDGAGNAEGKAIKDAIAVLQKKSLYDAYVAYLAASSGLNEKNDMETMEDNTAYIHGDLVYCNGIPLAETSDPNVGKDHASGMLFTLDENENIIEVKNDPKKVVPKKPAPKLVKKSAKGKPVAKGGVPAKLKRKKG